MYLGIDIGGTNTRIVTTQSLEDVVFEREVSINTNKQYDVAELEIIKTIREITENITAIGMGLPGSINNQGILDGSTNLPDWVGRPLKEHLEKAFNCKVSVKNDAEIGALGEAYYGSGKKTDFLYLTWGTGLGVAQIKWKDEKSQVSRPNDRQSIYDLEELVGGKNIEDRFGKEAQDLTEAEWSLVIRGLYKKLPSLVSEYGFASFVIGGGITVRKKELLEAELQGVSGVKIKITNLEGKAGLYGAIALCKNIKTV